MKSLVLLVALLTLTACKRSSFDADAALEWSEKAKVQLRQNSASFMDQDKEGGWVTISTAVQEETSVGLMYSGGEVLSSGYLVYPGGHRVDTIEEAIDLSKKSKGSVFPNSEDTVTQQTVTVNSEANT